MGNNVVVEVLRADSTVEVAKFRLSDVDLDCAVFGLFSAGSDGLCLMLLILREKSFRRYYKILRFSQLHNLLILTCIKIYVYTLRH